MPPGAFWKMNLTWNIGERLRSEEHTSELQSHHDLVCRLLLEKKKKNKHKRKKPIRDDRQQRQHLQLRQRPPSKQQVYRDDMPVIKHSRAQRNMLNEVGRENHT